MKKIQDFDTVDSPISNKDITYLEARDLNALEILDLKSDYFGFLKYQSTFLLDSNLNCSILWELKIVLRAHYSLILDHSTLELFPRFKHSVES